MDVLLLLCSVIVKYFGPNRVGIHYRNAIYYDDDDDDDDDDIIYTGLMCYLTRSIWFDT